MTFEKTSGHLAQQILASLKDYPDFPKPGIIFKDICPLLANPELFNKVIEELAKLAQNCGATAIAGLESRGFLLGTPVALRLNLPFIPIRKQGKLPGVVKRHTYALEYGTDTLEIQQTPELAAYKIFLVDDVLATGGTAAAAATLIREAGSQLCGYGFLLRLSFLAGETQLQKATQNAPWFALASV